MLNNFIKRICRCILVKNLPQNCSESQIQSYFQAQQRHEKEPLIERITMIEDGCLIVFRDEQIARTLLMRNHYIGKVQLKIFLKQIPPILKRRFVVKGNFNDSNQVEKILSREVLSDEEFKVDSFPDNQHFLITLKKSSDVEVTIEGIKKTKWEITNVTAFRMCHSDCVKISNIKGISNDKILEALQSHDCEVTLIRRQVNDVALVYIADYKDIRKLKNVTMIDGKVIKIEPYYAEFEASQPSLEDGDCDESNIPTTSKDEKQQDQNKSQHEKGNEAENESKKEAPKESIPSIKKFYSDIKADNDALELVCSSMELKSVLDEELMGLAKIEFALRPNRSSLSAYFTPVLKQTQLPNGNQTEFQRECVKRTNQYFREFTPQQHTFDPVIEKKIKEIYQSNNCQTRVDEMSIRVLVKWDQNKPGKASLIGLLHHVKKFEEMFQSGVDNISISTTELEIVGKCGIVDDAQKKFQVQIHTANNSSGLVLNGIRRDVIDAKEFIQTQLKDICRTNVAKFLQKPQCIFLRDISSKIDIESQIKRLFKEHNIKAVLQFDDNFTLIHTKQAYQSSINSLQNLIQCENWQVTEDFEKMNKDSKVENLENAIRGIPELKLIAKGNTLTLVGLQSKFSEGRQHILEYIQAIAEKEELVNFKDPNKTYFCDFMSKLNPPEELEDIEYHGNEEGIVLQGKAEDISRVSSWMKDTNKKLETQYHVIEEPWKVKYLQSKSGKQFLKTTSQNTTCLINIDHIDANIEEPTRRERAEPVLETFTRSKKFIPSMSRHSKYPDVLIPGTDVRIRVIKDDITRHKVDVMVNASNEELELRSAGVSGSILNQGGSSIQREMDEQRGKIGGRLLPGTAVTTGAGHLSFKKIIHVSGPVWYQSRSTRAESSKCLENSIQSCLSEAEKHNLTSISIPAISCGVFGGEPQTCARLIVKSIVEFFTMKTRNKRPSLHTIDLIEISNEWVIGEFSKQVESLIIGRSLNLGQTSATYHIPSTSDQQETSSLRVFVERGDILEDNGCDVIVNTAGPDFDLTKSQLSAKLLNKAGSSVQREIQNSRNSTTMRVTGSGNLPCKKIVHLIVPSRIENLSQNLLEVFELVEELQMSSIAVPAIGTGNGNFNSNDVASSIKSAIEKFKQKQPKHLKHIKLIIFEGSLFEKFKRLIKTFHLPSSSFSSFSKPFSHDTRSYADVLAPSNKKNQNALPSNFNRAESSSINGPVSKYQPIKLMYCSHQTENIPKAKRCIHYQFQLIYQETKVNDIAEEVLTKSNINLKELEKEHVVQIKFSGNPGSYELQISGLPDDVTLARKSLRNLLDEENEVD